MLFGTKINSVNTSLILVNLLLFPLSFKSTFARKIHYFTNVDIITTEAD